LETFGEIMQLIIKSLNCSTCTYPFIYKGMDFPVTDLILDIRVY